MSRTFKQKRTGGKAVSSHCQNNGCCNWCRDNRTISSQRAEPLDQEYIRMTKLQEGDFSTIKNCPRCQSEKLSKLEEVPGSSRWAYNFACLNCLRYFQINYGDPQEGGFDVIYERVYD